MVWNRCHELSTESCSKTGNYKKLQSKTGAHLLPQYFIREFPRKIVRIKKNVIFACVQISSLIRSSYDALLFINSLYGIIDRVYSKGKMPKTKPLDN